MEILGRLIYCDKCNLKIFLKVEKTFAPFGLALKNEDLPEGWKECFDAHLCPKCSKEWENFMGKKPEQEELC